MKNIEKYFTKLKDTLEESNGMHCSIHNFRDGKQDCSGLTCQDCFVESLTWFNEECIEPIKLTKFEYDLLTTIDANAPFNKNVRNARMLKLGHFKGITDTSMTIKEILENCDVMKDE